MLRKDKEVILQDLIEDFKEFNVFYFANYKGLNVTDMTTLRTKLKDAGIKLRIAKNTLIRVAREEMKISSIDKEVLQGNTAIVMSKDDPIAPAKIVRNFIREHQKPSIKGILLDNEFYKADKIKHFASLQGMDELRAKVVASIAAPISGLVFVLSGLLRGLVSQIDQLSKSEE